MTPLLAETLMPPAEFEATMSYFMTREGNSRDIAHAFHVLGQPVGSIATQFDCSRQNVVKVLARFAKAFERYNEVKRNMASTAKPPAFLAKKPAATAAKKVAPATKKAAPAAKKVARKKPAR